MRIPRVVLDALRRRLLVIPFRRRPDEMIGPGLRVRKRDYAGREREMPTPPKMFLRRWFLLPKNPIFNAYLHEFCRDDEDRSLHDHPWVNVSCLLAGCYVEHTIAAGGVHKRKIYVAGDLKFRMPWSAHRIELMRLPAEPMLSVNEFGKRSSWSLFITLWRMHHWGFHCPTEFRTNEEFAEKGGCPGSDYRALNLYKKQEDIQ